MKAKYTLTLVIVLLASALCFGQNESKPSRLEGFKTHGPFKPNSPLFVLKADDKTVELDAKKNSGFTLESINTKWIDSIFVLKDKDATASYGERGMDGVVIITFKDFNSLSDELQKIFRDSD